MFSPLQIASGLVSWWALDATPVESDLVSNGTFESNTTGWTAGNSTLSIASGGQSGNCLEITMTSTGTSSAYQWVSGLTEGVSYEFTAYVKSGTSGDDACKIQLTESNGTSVIATTSTTSSDTWTKISVVGAPVSGEVGMYVFVSRTATDAGTIFFDTVSGGKLLGSDSKGSNHGTVYGATIDEDLYGGDTPVKPRAIDNAPTVQADSIGAGSASFNGSSDYISTSNAIELGGATDFTITCWAKTDDWTNEIVMGKWQHTNYRWYLRGNASDYLELYSLSGSATGIHYTGTTALTNGEWIHLALVVDRDANIKGYMGG